MPADIVCRGCQQVFRAKRSDAMWCLGCRMCPNWGTLLDVLPTIIADARRIGEFDGVPGKTIR